MATTSSLLSGKYTAKAHAAKVAHHLNSLNPAYSSATIYLESQKTRLLEDNDEPEPFRQRRPFFYLSGVPLPDCALTYHIPTKSLTLFLPPLDPDSVIWSGLPPSQESALEKYDVDAVLTTSDLSSYFRDLEPQRILHIPDQAPPEEAIARPARPESTELRHLKEALETSRVTKTPYEINLLRHANEITTAAHTAVLRSLKKCKNERELEAVFTERCIALGAPKQAYHGIFGSGTNAATLHYVHNDETLDGRLNVLVDAAAEYNCYCADVTRTMPLSGAFTKESRAIYELVFKMQEECLGMLKAGVKWEDVHVRAHEVAIEGLLELGILKGGSKKEILDRGTSVAFFPHGLGHYLGMDTHDVGGNPKYGDENKMFRYLRVRGNLPSQSVITVEPGVYFCRFIIEPYIKDEKHKNFIDEGVLERYWDVGGVRIEDDILITENGYENLTTAPKTIEEMERIINS